VVAGRQLDLWPRFACISSTTLFRSRPATLAMTTILRCTFSRLMKYGPRSLRISASADSGRRAPLGVVISVARIASRLSRVAGS
jgi:hypothetical protein